MSCIVPKHIFEILDVKQFEAAMQQYGATKENLTAKHPFVTKYLQPQIQKIADDIATQSGRTEDWQKSRVSVVFFNPHSKNKTCSSHDHRTNEIIICWDKGTGTLEDQCRKLVNDTRHESEHANQTDGDGYSIDQRTLSRLSRISYHTGNDILYRNNYNEIRARMSEFQMHREIYHRLVKQNAPFAEIQTAAKNLIAAESHLTHLVSQQGQEQWMQRAQEDIKHMLFHTKKLMEVFPDAKSVAEAKQMAVTFLTQRAPDVFKDLRDELKVYQQEATQVSLQMEQQRVAMEKTEAHKAAMEKAAELNIPVLSQMPYPTPIYRLKIESMSRLEHGLSGENITLHNRAFVRENGEIFLIGDGTDRVRDYINKWPQEVQDQLNKNMHDSKYSVRPASNDTIALSGTLNIEDLFAADEIGDDATQNWDTDERFDD